MYLSISAYVGNRYNRYKRASEKFRRWKNGYNRKRWCKYVNICRRREIIKKEGAFWNLDPSVIIPRARTTDALAEHLFFVSLSLSWLLVYKYTREKASKAAQLVRNNVHRSKMCRDIPITILPSRLPFNYLKRSKYSTADPCHGKISEPHYTFSNARALTYPTYFFYLFIIIAHFFFFLIIRAREMISKFEILTPLHMHGSFQRGFVREITWKQRFLIAQRSWVLWNLIFIIWRVCESQSFLFVPYKIFDLRNTQQQNYNFL